MSCLWCLNHCVRTESDEQNPEEPLVDFVKILEQIAWKALAKDPPSALTASERICGLRKVLTAEVDTTFISVSHPDTLKLKAKELSTSVVEDDKTENGEGEGEPLRPQDPDVQLPPPASLPKGTRVLFQSRYYNNTNKDQTYSFKTERQTKSTIEMSMQRGFTIGQTLELDVKIPTGVKGCKVSGKLGGQMQWSFTRGKVSRQEDQVTWAVDSQVQVAKKTSGTATLAIKEMRWEADFTLDCLIRPRPVEGRDPELFPVFFRRRNNGQLIKVVSIPSGIIIKACESHFKPCEQDMTAIMCSLKGQCSSVCAINQRVWLDETDIKAGHVNFMHQDSMIQGPDN